MVSFLQHVLYWVVVIAVIVFVAGGIWYLFETVKTMIGLVLAMIWLVGTLIVDIFT